MGASLILVRIWVCVWITSDPLRANYEELTKLVSNYILPAIKQSKRDPANAE